MNDDRPATGIDKYLVSIRGLPADCTSDDIRNELGKIALAVREAAPLDRAFVREILSKELKSIGVGRASEIVNTAIPNTTGDQDRDAKRMAFEEHEAWQESVDSAELLDDISATVRRFVVMAQESADAIALWVLFSHCHDAAEISPILAVVSPEKRCGKTTTLQVIETMVPKPLPTSNITAAAIFRTVEKFEPTLLIDEADTFLHHNEEMRGILNSGHNKSGAFVTRTVGTDHDPMTFRTWCPKVIAKIGEMQSTLADRSIAIPLRRKSSQDTTSRFRQSVRASLNHLPRMAARFAYDHTHELRTTDPEIPSGLSDREADNWRLMVAIADIAGYDWPRRARDAACLLSGCADGGPSCREILLSDIKAMFKERHTDRLASDDIAEALIDMDDRPWPEYRNGKPLSKHQLARLLKPFGIRPSTLRINGNTTLKGYKRDSFQDAFNRYTEDETVTPSQINTDTEERLEPDRNTIGDVTDGQTENDQKNQGLFQCDGSDTRDEDDDVPF